MFYLQMHQRGSKVKDTDSEDENDERTKGDSSSHPAATQREKLPLHPNDVRILTSMFYHAIEIKFIQSF